MKKNSKGLYRISSVEQELCEIETGFSFNREVLIEKHVKLKNMHSHLNQNKDEYYKVYANPKLFLEKSYYRIAKSYLLLVDCMDVQTSKLLISDALKIRNNELLNIREKQVNNIDRGLINSYSNLAEKILEDNRNQFSQFSLGTESMDFETPFYLYQEIIKLYKKFNTNKDKYLISEEYKKLSKLYRERYKCYITDCKELEEERKLIRRQSVDYYKKSIECKKELLCSNYNDENKLVLEIIEDCEEGIKLFPKKRDKLFFLNVLLELSLLQMENALLLDIYSIDVKEVKKEIKKSITLLYGIKNGEINKLSNEQLEIVKTVLENLEKSRDIDNIDPRFSEAKEYHLAQ